MSRLVLRGLLALCALTAAALSSVHAHDASFAGLAVSPWPMIGRNPQHTGRSQYASPSTPQLNWTFQTGGDLYYSAAIGADGTVYFGSDDGKLYAVNPDGIQRWSFDTGGRIRFAPALGNDGTVYFVASDVNKLFAINPDASLKWSYNLLGSSSPVVTSDGTVYVGDVDGGLHAIGSSGLQKWSFRAPPGHWSPSPAAVGDDGTIYFASYAPGPGGVIIAVNPDGAQKWSIETADRPSGFPAIGSDGTVYFPTQTRLYAVAPDATVRWTFASECCLSSAAIAQDGALYVGNGTAAAFDGSVIAIGVDGSQRWSTKIGGALVGSAPTIDANGVIHAGVYNYNNKNVGVVSLGPDGAVRWTYATGGLVQFSPVISATGHLFVGSGHALYSLGADTVAPTGSILLDSGAAYTNGGSVVVTASASDNIGISGMQLSEDPSFPGAGWMSFAQDSFFSLSDGGSQKTVYARFRDEAGNVSEAVSDSIGIETDPPSGRLRINASTTGSTVGALSTTSSEVAVALEAGDEVSGLDAYRLANEGGDWTDWAPVEDGIRESWTLSVGDGTRVVQVQYRDKAGNVSLPITDAIDLDTTVSSEDFGLSVNNGATFTNSADVVLTLPAKAGTAEMMPANDGGFAGAAWEPYATRRAWTIRTYGTQVITDVVYVKFRSADGTVSDVRSDDIVYDPNPPQPMTAGRTALAGSSVLRLDTRAQDDRSGVAAMMLGNDRAFRGGQWEPYQADREWPVSDGARTTIYVRYRDGAGNMSDPYLLLNQNPERPSVPAQLGPAHGLLAGTLRPAFEWAAVPGAKRYQVQVSTKEDFSKLIASRLQRHTRFRPQRALPANTLLYWRVRLEGGEWSPVWRFRTPVAEPPAMRGPLKTDQVDPLLTWGAVRGAKSYQVQVSLSLFFTEDTRDSTAATNSLRLPALARATAYWWRVRARVGDGWTAWSTSILSTPLLETPRLLRPRDGAEAGGRVTLDWLDVTGAERYRVRVCADDACASVARAVEATNSRLELESLAVGEYWWRVQAVGAKGVESAWSRAWGFRK